ncbi:MAG: hypothetical protein KDA89_01835 [Planctomycetaceae bacterium]|nr:hypothetical protein [Planctomycetaceae bacterium]
MTRLLHNIAGIAAALALLSTGTSALGQTGGDQQYVLRVPSSMSIEALRDDQLRNHPGTTGNITFTDSVWYAQTASNTGSTVRLTVQQPFQHETVSSSMRDVRLRTPRMFVTPGSGWKFDKFTDQTDYVGGDLSAEVQVSSRRAGRAIIFLEVTFLTGDPATLQGGDYTATVIGTISAN